MVTVSRPSSRAAPEQLIARLWSLDPREVRAKLLAPAIEVGRDWIPIGLSPNDRWLVTVGDGLRLWDFNANDPGKGALLLRNTPGQGLRVAGMRRDSWLVAVDQLQGGFLWDLSVDKPDPNPFRLRDLDLNKIAISFVDRWLITRGINDTIRIWELKSGKPPDDPTILRSRRSLFQTSFIDSVKKRLVFLGDDGQVRLVDFSRDDPFATAAILPNSRGTTSIAPLNRPGDRWLFASGPDDRARLWDLDHPSAAPILVRGQTTEVSALNVSPDGRWVATGDDRGDIRLWDLSGGDHVARPVVLRYHQKPLSALAFTLDGRRLISADLSGVRLWTLPVADLIRLARDAAGRNLTRSEWEQVNVDVPYRPTFPELPVPKQ
jgi:WD40 repeat protein